MSQIIISPSVLSMDYSKMKEQVDALNASKAEWMHFDVMDGHFVPNITFGPDILKGFRKMTDMVLDVHLMVSDPEKYAPIFVDAGADMVTFHVEALDNDLNRISNLLKNKRDEKGYSYRIEVDGGINGSTFHTAIEAGSDTLVAGSYVFKGDIVEQVASLLR